MRNIRENWWFLNVITGLETVGLPEEDFLSSWEIRFGLIYFYCLLNLLLLYELTHF